jgi:undecaprenyl-diphosphatase
MTWWQALGLGIVQGLTEFLPVSSSGHLSLFSFLFGLQETNLTFVMVVHAATLLAVAIYFWKALLKLRLNGLILLGIATVPAVVIGLAFKDAIEASFNSLLLTGVTLAMTGGINLLTDRKLNQIVAAEASTQKTNDAPLSPTAQGTQDKGAAIETWQLNRWLQVFKVGIMQAVAIIPGISRSGSTVFAGIWVGWTREEAFTFSFLMSLPAVGGAVLLQGIDWLEGAPSGVSSAALVIGFGASFIAGYASLWMMEYMIKRAKYEYFGYYCIVVGLLATCYALVR